MRRKTTPRPPMLVMRGLRNDQLELRERAAVQAFALGYATTEHYHILADMHSVMLLAGSTDDSRKWAWTYCTEVTGPALQKIAQRYQRTKVMSVTTGERKVLGEFITRYREFWLRQRWSCTKRLAWRCKSITTRWGKRHEKLH